jgi:Flp pilus assembly protein TadB
MRTVVATASATQPAGHGGVPLPLVCALVFVAILTVTLVAFTGAGAGRGRRRDARVAELRRYRVLAARIDHASADDPPSALHLLGRVVDRRGKRRAMAAVLEQAGLRMRPEEWLAIRLAAVAVPAVLGVLLTGSVLGVVAGLLGWIGTAVLVRIKVRRRGNAFTEQLPDALQLVAGALRAGFALNQSITAVARESAEPVAGEFSRVLQEVRLGAELEDALDDLATRMDSYDMRLVVTSIRTAREIGGNLAEVLQTTVATMRERVQLRGQVNVLSAEGRFSAKVLTGLPLVMAGYLLLFKKDYLRPMYTTGVGVALLVAGAVLLAVGSVWLHKLTKIEV